MAVATGHGTYTREINTGRSERAENMVAFTREGLQLMKDVLLGKASL